MKLLNFFKHNWFAILYFNFKMLPFKQAIKLPFDFYGRIKFKSLTGNIIINTNINRGCFQFGLAESEIFPQSPIIFSLKGNLILTGTPICIGSGSVIEINKNATVEFGSDVLIASRNKIISRKMIKFGSHIRMSWEGQVFDSNFHYMRNIKTNAIPPINKEIIIGNNIWIANRVTINKGTKLPDYTIIASNSLCNKDYQKNDKQYITLAGSPAQIVTEGYERIFESLEPELTKTLSENENNK